MEVGSKPGLDEFVAAHASTEVRRVRAHHLGLGRNLTADRADRRQELGARAVVRRREVLFGPAERVRPAPVLDAHGRALPERGERCGRQILSRLLLARVARIRKQDLIVVDTRTGDLVLRLGVRILQLEKRAQEPWVRVDEREHRLVDDLHAERSDRRSSLLVLHRERELRWLTRTVHRLVRAEGNVEGVAVASKDRPSGTHHVAVLVHDVGLDAIAPHQRVVHVDGEARLALIGLQRAHDDGLSGVQHVDVDVAPIVGRGDVDLHRVADLIERLVGSDDQMFLARLDVEIDRSHGGVDPRYARPEGKRARGRLGRCGP